MGWVIVSAIIVVVVVGGIFAYAKEKEVNETIKDNEQNIREYLKRQNFQESKCLYLNVNKIRIDEKNKNIAICYNGTSQYRIIPFSNVRDVSIYEDGIEGKKSGISRAIVGGILAGGAGAIVGSSTAKNQKFINSYGLKVYTTNINEPLFYFPMITQQTKKDSIEYRTAENSVEQAFATIGAIIEQND